MEEAGSGSTTSCWREAVRMPDFPNLDRDLSADVCIVGAGISGISTAYLLAREGRKVIVLDDGPVGGGETGRTTAHLSNAIDDRFTEIEKWRGPGCARLAAESHGTAIDRIERIVSEENIDCDFRRLDGYLYSASTRGDDLQAEYNAARRAGLNVELVERAPAPFNTGRALRFPRQGQFHPLKYLRALTEAIRQRGGEIYTGTAAREIKGGDHASVKTREGHTVTAAAVVVATNTPINDWVVMHTKQAPYRTYAIGVEIPRASIEPILLWDNLDPYHYVRLQPGAPESAHDILIVGGEDHKTGQARDMAAPFGRLEKWTRERYPNAGAIRFRWSGQVLEPLDGLGYIGRNPQDAPNLFIITGDSGQGMTHGTIGGMLITDLIVGRRNSWEALYDPSRKPLSTAREFARENLNVAAQYKDYLRPGEVRSTDEIRPGCGALIRHGKTKIAAYKDENGEVHELSAVCTHLQCIVHWNDVEKSWDCPCHGSRFDPQGRILNGPAIADLEPIAAHAH